MENDFQIAPLNDFFQNRQTRQCARIMLLIGLFFLSSMMLVTNDNTMKAKSNAVVQDRFSGEWTAEIDKDNADKIRLSLNRRREKGNMSMSDSNFSLADLQGLTREQMSSAKSDVRFRLVREAGIIECEGIFQNGKGAGHFTFTPDENFLSEMHNRGFGTLDDEQKFAAAMLNVTTKIADDLKSLGFKNLDIDDLFKATIFRITPELVSEMRSIGYDNPSMEDLVQARIFKITPEFAREVAAMGFGRQPMESLVQMRIFKITPNFIREMKAAGLENLEIEDLVQLRIFKIDPEFIQRAKVSGAKKLDVSDLVQMKIHGGKRSRDDDDDEDSN